MTGKQIRKAIKRGTAKAAVPANQATLGLGRPITIKLSGGKNKTNRRGERTSSHGARRFAQIDRRVSKALRRLTRAYDHGIDTYIDHRKRSARNRRDGASVDLFENTSYGLSKTISESSPVLHDVAETLNSRPARKQIRTLVRGFGRLPFV